MSQLRDFHSLHGKNTGFHADLNRICPNISGFSVSVGKIPDSVPHSRCFPVWWDKCPSSEIFTLSVGTHVFSSGYSSGGFSPYFSIFLQRETRVSAWGFFIQRQVFAGLIVHVKKRSSERRAFMIEEVISDGPVRVRRRPERRLSSGRWRGRAYRCRRLFRYIYGRSRGRAFRSGRCRQKTA